MAEEGLAYLQYQEVEALSQEAALPQVAEVEALSQEVEWPQAVEAVAVMSQELPPPLVLLRLALELREFPAQQPVLRELLFQ